ncbi:cupin domain-containing protein [Catenulispora pinisilvae]|uniref:cupin domain-containing protein n=1 Tax=Catenulispora pinisilvae TaxID=2705253 RepID=UPI00189248F1|nr:cupin domain-containing protein [Catenulispora pinisilvae]
MHVFNRSTAQASTTGAVQVIRWEQFQGADQLPFGGMWYSVAPGGSSAKDQHPDVELSLVLGGVAEVEAADGTITAVPAGSGFLLASNESHIVHNSSPDTPVVVFSAYWMPDGDPDNTGTRER